MKKEYLVPNAKIIEFEAKQTMFSSGEDNYGFTSGLFGRGEDNFGNTGNLL